ncbi:MAG: substrate-binding domain-containing protein [Planctomycetes bacterium]|nr:substrate-binding domain-containing protein [Planctomycetota bacterium]
MAGSSGKLPTRRRAPQKGVDTRTPLAPTAVRAPLPRLPHDKPRVGFLHWATAKDLDTGYCSDLYLYFVRLGERGEIELVTLGEIPSATSPPYPLLDRVKAARFDAIVSNGIWSADYLTELSKLNVPVVSCDHDAAGVPIDSVLFDGMKGGELAGKLILDYGHSDVLFVNKLRRDLSVPRGADPWTEDSTCAERRAGIQHALVGTNAEFWPLVPWVSQSGVNLNIKLKETFEKILAEMGHWPTVIVAPDLGIARAMRGVLQEFGLSVPQHVSLLTYNARPNEDRVVPPEERDISNLQYSWREMADQAWRMLRARLAGVQAPPKRVALRPHFVDYGSLGPRREGP